MSFNSKQNIEPIYYSNENFELLYSTIEKFSNSKKIKFRKITDQNELADTIIFNFKTQKLADKCVESLAKVGVGTKNIPDAMKWHFNKHFTQIWNNTPYYKNYKSAWAKSDELLTRSVSLPVMVNWSEEDCKIFGQKVLNVLNSI